VAEDLISGCARHQFFTWALSGGEKEQGRQEERYFLSLSGGHPVDCKNIRSTGRPSPDVYHFQTDTPPN